MEAEIATCGPVVTVLYRELGGCIAEVDCNVLVLFGAMEAGCFKEVTALYSDHLRQVSLYHQCRHIRGVCAVQTCWLYCGCTIQECLYCMHGTYGKSIGV